MSDKVHEIVKRWELIEDQLSGLEYHILNEKHVDGIDVDYASKFASVRSQLATIRVQYQEAKSNNTNSQGDEPVYDFGAPRFPYDDFPPNK
jgi:hypothetical protein